MGDEQTGRGGGGGLRRSRPTLLSWQQECWFFASSCCSLAWRCSSHLLRPLLLLDIFTEVPYSTLIKQIRARQVEAANIQGTVLDALLVPERSDPLVSNQANEVAVFGACLPQDLTGCFDEQGKPRFSRTRIILTFLPTSELPSVLALLLKHRVVVSIARVSAPPWWVLLLWKVAPF